ncbi:phage portal protein [Campylobacter fetus]|nr:phage portal protein [Campylobacter fetus]OCS39953.1 portal protein [Campylobacter fetus subsp. venerealis cfvi92/203]EAK0416633.1 phage portal protein [Campylobacter fetus]EAK5853265.1 phage portal protein [Campylobacter fetus]ELY2080808.1 phage portal protein [Campylobacter fetus]MBD3866427.1 phage portal protein [Campylobacter fetus]
MNRFFIEKDAKQSLQIGEETTSTSGIIEPFFSFNQLLEAYYANVYHRRAIKIKAGLLSQIETEESDLEKFLPAGVSPKNFLNTFAFNLELYGNAAIEKAGGSTSYLFYNLPANQMRLKKDRRLFQKVNEKIVELEGYHFFYYSPNSRYYGEPDYLAALQQILINQKADLYNDKFFDNGARPDLAIIYENAEPSEEQIKAFENFFGSNFRGYNNSHKTLIIYGENSANDKDAKIRFEELGRVSDLSFKELKSVTRDEIAVAHAIPPRLLGIVQGSALGGSGELSGQLQMFNELEIKPKIEMIESFFTNIGVKVTLKAMDTASFKDDGEIVTTLVGSGILSIEEARSILGWQKNI